MNKVGFDHPAEWVSFVDPETKVTYHFEWTFLCSGLTCIYGNGCQGLHGNNKHQGCCDDGVYFVDNEDRDHTLKLAKWLAEIDPDMWEQRPAKVTKNTIFEQNKDGEWKTLRTKKGCIFLNADGCALHSWSLKYEEDPDDNKPYVCTAVPMQIRFDDSGHDVWIGTFDNERWFQEHQDDGSAYADWYCVEDRRAYKAHTPFFQRYKKAIVSQIPEHMYQEFERWYINRLGQGKVQVTKLKPTGNGWRS